MSSARGDNRRWGNNEGYRGSNSDKGGTNCTQENWRGKGKMVSEAGSDDQIKAGGGVLGEQEKKGVFERSGKGGGFDKEGCKALGEVRKTDNGMATVSKELTLMDAIGEVRVTESVGPVGSTQKEVLESPMRRDADMDKGPSNLTILGHFDLDSGIEIGKEGKEDSGPLVAKANIIFQGNMGNKKLGRWKRIGNEGISVSRKENLGKKLGKKVFW